MRDAGGEYGIISGSKWVARSATGSFDQPEALWFHVFALVRPRLADSDSPTWNCLNRQDRDRQPANKRRVGGVRCAIQRAKLGVRIETNRTPRVPPHLARLPPMLWATNQPCQTYLMESVRGCSQLPSCKIGRLDSHRFVRLGKRAF